MQFNNLKIKEIISVVRYTPDKWQFSSTNRNSHIIGIQISGSALHTFKNKKLTLSENCVYFLNQKDDYHVTVNEACRSFSIHFTAYEPIETDSFCIRTGAADEIIRMLELIERNFLQKDDSLKLLAQFYEFCSVLNNLYEKKFYKKDIRITESEKYMRLHFREADCLEKAAELSQLSRRRFNDLFRRHFDITPNNYLLNLKINCAKALIKTNGISVSGAAYMSGFNDIGYFSKCFKKLTGVSPSKFI